MSSKQAADVPLGMLDGAYFTSRKDILDFFNSLLSMSLTKIEQTASGAVACQLMDYLFPGSISMKRVNWEAKSEFQYIENYKILQAAFTKQRVQKDIDVDRLIRARYQDNLEFCQWLKAFFEHANASTRDDYDALSRRMLGKGGKRLDVIYFPPGKGKKNAIGNPRVKIVGGIATSGAGAGGTSSSRTFSSSSSVCSSRSISSRSTTTSKRSVPSVLRENNVRPNKMPAPMNKSSKHVEKLLAENKDLKSKNAQLRRNNTESELVLENIEKERDFYFDKLRGIEVMLQVYEEKNLELHGGGADAESVMQQIFKVLYAKTEDNIIVTDDGELLGDIENGDHDLLNDSGISIMDEDSLIIDP